MKRSSIIATLAGLSTALWLLRRYGLHSGATWEEYQQPFPGDKAIPRPDLEITNAITIHASPEEIWPWLVQLGYYRGGWFTDSTWRDWDYLPDKVMRYFVRDEAEKSGYGHRDTPTSAEIVAEFQNLKQGEIILDGPPGTAFFTVMDIEPNKRMVLYSDTHLRFLFPQSIRANPKIGIGGEFTWGFFLEPINSKRTRLLLRTRGIVRPLWYRILIQVSVPIANIFLARKMLGGIKRHAEESHSPLN
jgi:proline iminopeptidase